MTKTLESIEESIRLMDSIYDANFGEWIRNEQNCKVVGQNIKKYIGKYDYSDFIMVIKWIVKEWTLKGIMQFTKKFITDDLFKSDKSLFSNKINILAGMIYTWNSLFISEFLLTKSSSFNVDEKCEYYYCILDGFDQSKLCEILLQMETKTDEETKEKLIEKFNRDIYNVKKKRTGSILDAMNLL